jgi:hypothetical protein
MLDTDRSGIDLFPNLERDDVVLENYSDPFCVLHMT